MLLPSDFSDLRILITGHTGFKGSWLTHLLKVHGAKVGGYALPPEDGSHFGLSGTEKLLSFNAYDDIRDLDALQSAYKEFKPEVVIHLAAQPLVSRGYTEPSETISINVMGTQNVLQASTFSRTPRTLVITTDKVYRDLATSVAKSENDQLGGFDPYSASKAAADIITQSWMNLPDLESLFSISRGGNVIGGGDHAANRLIPDIERSLSSGITLKIRNPNQVRPWQHVLDCLDGYLTILKAAGADFAEAWNVGPKEEDSGVPVSAVIETYLSSRGSSLKMSTEQGNFHETPYLALDTSKISQRLGWTPRMSTTQSIQAAASWNRKVFSELEDPAKVTEHQIAEYLSMPIGSVG